MPDRADLGEHFESFVAELVAGGRYASRSSVLREGLTLLVERERKLSAFNAAIDEGLADIEAGRVRTADDVFDRLEAKYAAMMTAPHE